MRDGRVSGTRELAWTSCNKIVDPIRAGVEHGHSDLLSYKVGEIAARRGQTLAQMALAWVLHDERMTSALVGASSVEQLEQNVGALDRLDFTAEELEEIDRYATDSDVNIWAASSEE